MWEAAIYIGWFFTHQPHLDQLVFLDETVVGQRDMNPRGGWAFEGHRAVVEGWHDKGLSYSVIWARDMYETSMFLVLDGACASSPSLCRNST